MENHTHVMQFTWDTSAWKHIHYAANKGSNPILLGVFFGLKIQCTVSCKIHEASFISSLSLLF